MFHQNSVPQIPGIGDAPTLFPGAGGQFPDVPHPMGLSLPTAPGAPTAQLPSIGNVPPHTISTGFTRLPSAQMPVSGLSATGNLPPHLPSEIPSSPGFPGLVSVGLPGMGDITTAPQKPGFPSGSFPAGISTPGLTPQDLSANTGAAQVFSRMPSSLTPSNVAGTGQMPMPGFEAGQVPSATSLLGLISNSGTTPGMAGMPFSGLPSGVPLASGLPQLPGRIPTGITPHDLEAGLGLPTQSSQSGIAGFALNPDQLSIQDSSFGESGGSIPQIPVLGTRGPEAVSQINGMLPSVPSQVAGMPTDITSAAGMVPTSTALGFPSAAGLEAGGYGTIIPGSQVNSGILPPGSSQVVGAPTDITSADGIVPPAAALGFPGGAMIPGSQVNFGMEPQHGLLPSFTDIPTGSQHMGDITIPTNPYTGSVDKMGATRLQEMGLQPNVPNPDLLVRTDHCKSIL